MYFDNILDEEFKTLIVPFDVVQRLFLLPKFKLYKNFIFFNSRTVDLISLFGVIIPGLCYIIRCSVYPILHSNTTYMTLAMIDGVSFCLGFLISYISNLFYRKLNVGLILNIHSIFKMLKFNEHRSVAIFNAVSWFAFAALTLYQASILAVFMNFTGTVFLDSTLLLCLLFFDMNVIYASRIVNLIDSHLELWVSELDRLTAVSLREKINNNYKIVDVESLFSENSNRPQSTTKAKEEWTRLLKGYRKILDTYNMFKKTSQHLMLYNDGQCFFHAVLLVQYSIEIIFDSPNANFIYYDISIFLFSLKSLVLLIVLSFTFEHFYTTVEKAQRACLRAIKSKDFAENVGRQSCKNALRLTRVLFSKTRVYGLYAVDAALPLRFMAALVDYVVALLQIALGRT